MIHVLGLFVALSFNDASIFTPVQADPHAHAASVPGPRPVGGFLVRTDTAALAAALETAPDFDASRRLTDYAILISLPHPSGGMVPCFVAESPVMEPALQARYPEIRTYLVQSEDGVSSGRLELAPRGLTAMLRSPDGAWMIDLWQSADSEHVVSYWMHDLRGGSGFVCETTEADHGDGAVPPADPAAADPTPTQGGFGERALQNLRTVRLAMACTGEYGLYHSTIQGNEPNIADPLAAIVTVVARSNVVYEQDVAVHFNLVANNDLLIFTDPATDPYDASCGGGGGADCSGPLLGANINLLSSVIGNENFEVGHVVTRIFGGVAYLRAVCGNSKGGAVSGMPRGGDVDPFAANVVIHELGHQFGANHTFSGTRGRCAGNVSLGTAWEAGSGSSPMAYAGACPVGDAPPSDNIVQFADPFFHSGNYVEMTNFLNSPTTTCPVVVATANSIPVIVSTTASTSIPPGTPFTLTAAATDANNDALTYSWEQNNTGVARPLSGEGSEDNGSGSLFRIFRPVTSPSRTFPKLADILSGVPTPGERLPTVTGVTRRFRVIVRDNYPGAGAVAISDNIFLSIVGSPFAVTFPTLGSRLSSGPVAVTWSVGGTSGPPISAPQVTIELSTNGGQTFGSLGTFPNTGSASVRLPDIGPSEAHIRIAATGRIFFAMSREFLVNVPCSADLDHDGDVDSDDIIVFFGGFDSGDADIDGDDDTDSDDILAFFTAFESGCGT